MASSLFESLGLALSEKQTPQVVENHERPNERMESLESRFVLRRQTLYLTELRARSTATSALPCQRRGFYARTTPCLLDKNGRDAETSEDGVSAPGGLPCSRETIPLYFAAKAFEASAPRVSASLLDESANKEGGNRYGRDRVAPFRGCVGRDGSGFGVDRP